jgi:hypothetical protein
VENETFASPHQGCSARPVTSNAELRPVFGNIYLGSHLYKNEERLQSQTNKHYCHHEEQKHIIPSVSAIPDSHAALSPKHIQFHKQQL